MAPRRPPPMDGSSGPETKVQRGIVGHTTLHCFVRLMRLPIHSILPLRSCFFAERGCTHSPMVQWTGRYAARFVSGFSGFGFSRFDGESQPAHQYPAESCGAYPLGTYTLGVLAQSPYGDDDASRWAHAKASYNENFQAHTWVSEQIINPFRGRCGRSLTISR
jgi:hypothetical protein